MFHNTSRHEKFSNRRGWRGGEEVSRVPFERLCLTVPKKFVGELFTVSLTPIIEKFNV